MKIHPLSGALVACLLLAGCASPSTAPDTPATSQALSDAKALGEKTWAFVESTTAQAVSFVNEAMSAGHRAFDGLTRR